MSNVSFNSPYYPYEKPNEGYNTLAGAEDIPYKLIMYLLDLPDKNGYEPVDDNSRPRVRLAKYLWYDEANPLSKALPTAEQKLSMLYTGDNAMIATEEDKAKHPKGYRIMGQNYTEPTETDARTLLKCYMAREIARSDFKTILSIDFEVSTNYALDNNMRTEAYSRMFAVHQCIIEALHGVNVAGVGMIYYNKSMHSDCGYTLYHTEGTTIYSDTILAIEWQESEPTGETVIAWN